MESDINIDTEEGDGPLVEVEVWNTLRFLLYVLFVKFSNIRNEKLNFLKKYMNKHLYAPYDPKNLDCNIYNTSTYNRNLRVLT